MWNLNIDQYKYLIEVNLNSSGFFSGLFNFSGHYVSSGLIENGLFVPVSYNQKWKTRKKNREINMVFENNKVVVLKQSPKEVGKQRIDFENLLGYSDPLTSILKLLNNSSESKTIDGRRVYIISLNKISEVQNKKIYSIKDYNNIWADHKRNDLEQIIIMTNSNKYLPEAIHINFKGQLFKIEKN